MYVTNAGLLILGSTLSILTVAVGLIDDLSIIERQPGFLTHVLLIQRVQALHDQVAIGGPVSWSVVHDGAQVILHPKVDIRASVELSHVVTDIFPVYEDVVVPVIALLFVPHAQGVTDFVDRGTELMKRVNMKE